MPRNTHHDFSLAKTVIVDGVEGEYARVELPDGTTEDWHLDGLPEGVQEGDIVRVRPKNMVISVGPNNYGHPTASALSLYAKVGAKVWRTDRQGTVTVTVKQGGAYTVSAERSGTQTPSSVPSAPPLKPVPVPMRPATPQPPAVGPAPTPTGVVYRNCSEARAAGVTPLRRGQPGYSSKLDRDGDGTACE